MLAVFEAGASGLTAAQEKALAALLEGKSVSQAAKRAGVARSTVYGWLRQDDFVAQLRAGEGRLLDGAVRRLLVLQDAAIGTLEAILGNPDASNATRLRAAALVLDVTIRLRELRNVEERLATLEAALHG